MESLLDTWEAAGFVGPILAVCCVMLWYAIGVRLVILRIPADLSPGALSRAEGSTVLLRGVAALRAQTHGGRAPQTALVAAAAPFHEALGRYAAVVRSTTAVAPLAGLLGTVTGMIETFDSLGSMELFSRGGGIGGGISEAMISTQMGLVVAVPGILLGAMLDRRQQLAAEALDGVIDALTEPSRKEAA